METDWNVITRCFGRSAVLSFLTKNELKGAYFTNRDPKKSNIQVGHVSIHPSSHKFHPNKNYVGLMVYFCKGKNDFGFHGARCRAGDVFIKEPGWINK